MIFSGHQVSCKLFSYFYFRKNKFDAGRRFTSSYDPAGRSSDNAAPNSNATFRASENNSNSNNFLNKDKICFAPSLPSPSFATGT